MSTNKTASRRTFLKGGALLAAPLATASVTAAVMADGRLQQRISHLEDEAAIRTLHQDWLRRMNAGDRDPRLDPRLQRLIADYGGAADRIEIAADRHTASGQFACAVELRVPLPRDSTLAQMAHAQGHGATHRTERRVLSVGYVREAAGWRIASIALS
jgi:hypothetical protein